MRDGIRFDLIKKDFRYEMRLNGRDPSHQRGKKDKLLSRYNKCALVRLATISFIHIRVSVCPVAVLFATSTGCCLETSCL
jgi:hypothetical protein